MVDRPQTWSPCRDLVVKLLDAAASGSSLERRLRMGRRSASSAVMVMSELGKMITQDPQLARSRILKALERTEGNRTRAATALGVQRCTFMRWLDALDMAGDVDARWPWPRKA